MLNVDPRDLDSFGQFAPENPDRQAAVGQFQGMFLRSAAAPLCVRSPTFRGGEGCPEVPRLQTRSEPNRALRPVILKAADGDKRSVAGHRPRVVVADIQLGTVANVAEMVVPADVVVDNAPLIARCRRK